MARIVELDLESHEARERPLESFAADHAHSRLVYWIRVTDEEDDVLRELAPGLGLSPDELEYLLGESPRPGMVEREASLGLGLEFWDASHAGTAPSVVRLHFTEKLCVARVAGSVSAIDTFEAICARELRFARSSSFMLFLVLDALVDDLAGVLARLDDECEEIGSRIHERFDSSANENILALKRRVLVVKRLLSNVREVMMRLSGRKMTVVSEAARESLIEVYGHAQALLASAESTRELVSSLLEAYMSVQAQRLNQTMKVLTLFASVLLPMTLIAGVYGMNFDHMPELHWRYGYYGALALIGGCGLGTFLWFRRKRWL